MRTWKSTISPSGYALQTTELPPGTPVLIVDASGFPDDYPIAGDWRSYKDTEVEVLTTPYFVAGVWFVRVKHIRSCAYSSVECHRLKPIPKEATGEVVGTVTVESTASGTKLCVSDAGVPDGTYDIIKRGSHD